MIAILSGFCSPTLRAEDIAPRTLTWTGDGTLKQATDVVREQTRFEIDVSAVDAEKRIAVKWSKVPFWTALEELASKVGGRVSITKNGQRIAIVPAREFVQPSAVSGPWRISARSIQARGDLETGDSSYELGLDVNWEPRMKVFRIDAYPKIRVAKDDRDRVLTSPSIQVFSPVTGFTAPSTLRLNGLTRASQRIATLDANFRATVAEKMLVFRFANFDGAKEQKIDGIEVTQSLVKRGTNWTLDLTLQYGDSLPTFESFENWTLDNTLELISPEGKSYPLEDPSASMNGRGPFNFRYRFNEEAIPKFDRKTWTMVYSAPSMIKEVVVPFTLRDVILP